MRSLLLAVILIGNLGLQAELLLLDHAESTTQWIPHFVLALGLFALILVYLRPRPSTLSVFRLIMVVVIVTGVVGLYFHYSGNVEFAMERSPELSGLALVWKALRGATPALSPGAMIQLGLLGLLYAYKHPGNAPA